MREQQGMREQQFREQTRVTRKGCGFIYTTEEREKEEK